jgi:AcrR family transcriptional regulator
MTSSAAETAPRRGRPAAASREDVLEAATNRYLRGHRVDVQAIAAELGLGRTTIYRWFGSREGLIGDVLVSVTKPLLAEARAGA